MHISNEVKGKKVIVAGESQLIGEKVSDLLRRRGATVLGLNTKNSNLLCIKTVNREFESFQADYCINLATYSGNVQFNQKYPADTFFRTTTLILNVLYACMSHKVKKVVSVMSSCAIADLPDTVLKETDLLLGSPNTSIESHGLAKRNMDAYSRQLRKQYGLNAVTCILQNTYGEGDSTDLEKTKVVMSLIKKFVDARNNNSMFVELWGSGQPLRELIYAWDAAEGIIQVMERYDEDMPINIGSDVEVTIKELANIIKDLVGFKGEVVWNTTKSDGQMRKKLDLTKMYQYLNFNITPLVRGLKETILWYEHQYNP
jgi:GDP-L-fucose synthase